MSDDNFEFKINIKYADKYDKWRRKEEYQKLKDKYGEDAVDSSSEVEDDNAEEITPQFEKDFLRALASVKSGNPKIYDKQIQFFREEVQDGEHAEETENKKRKATRKEKPMFLKDYERKIIVEKGGRFSDDEDEDGMMRHGERPSSPTYVEEQEMIRSSFKDALREDIEDESLLKRKKKTKKDKEQEDAEYLQWLKGERQEISDEEQAKEAQDVAPLREYWNDPQLEDGEKFLRDYILNKAYLPTTDDLEGTSYVDLSEDDRDLDAQDTFERKFNFRFEEPDSEFVKTFPRNVEGSKRTKDTSRAQKRQEVKKRKGEEKKKMYEELKQMKNLKKQEILEQLEKLKRVTGNTKVGFDENDLDGDFDSNQHDQIMRKVFSEDYNALEEDGSKPVFEDEEFEEENWDEWTGDYKVEGDNAIQPHCDDVDFNMDADYDPTAPKKEKRKKNKKDRMKKKDKKAPALNLPLSGTEGRKRGKHQSLFSEALYNKKPIFDPEDETFDNYFDEYYKLDYEDLIGDLPCRFKYRQVVANDFGLTAEETLFAEEKELNRWASLKKTCQYRTRNEELSDLSSYKEKGLNDYKKRQVFRSLHEEEEEAESDDDKDIIGNEINEVQTSSSSDGKEKAEDANESSSIITNSKGSFLTNNESLSSEDNTSGTEKKKRKKMKKIMEEEERDDSVTFEEERPLSSSKFEKGKYARQDEEDIGNKLFVRKEKTISKTKKRVLLENYDVEETRCFDLGVERTVAQESDKVDKRVSHKDGASNKSKSGGNINLDENGSSLKSKDGDGATESGRSRKRKLIEDLQKRRKRKMKKSKIISDNRLKAYGIRPKAYKYKLIQDRIKQKQKKC